MDSLRRVFRAIRVASRSYEKTIGVSAAQLFVLQKLNTPKAISLNELAQKTYTHQSSVSVVVSRLVSRGFVEKKTSSHDSRAVELSLTNAGREALSKSPATVQDSLLEGIQKLSPQNQKTLAKLFAKWVSESGIDRVHPASMFEEDEGGEIADATSNEDFSVE